MGIGDYLCGGDLLVDSVTISPSDRTMINHAVDSLTEDAIVSKASKQANMHASHYFRGLLYGDGASPEYDEKSDDKFIPPQSP